MNRMQTYLRASRCFLASEGPAASFCVKNKSAVMPAAVWHQIFLAHRWTAKTSRTLCVSSNQLSHLPRCRNGLHYFGLHLRKDQPSVVWNSCRDVGFHLCHMQPVSNVSSASFLPNILGCLITTQFYFRKRGGIYKFFSRRCHFVMHLDRRDFSIKERGSWDKGGLNGWKS